MAIVPTPPATEEVGMLCHHWDLLRRYLSTLCHHRDQQKSRDPRREPDGHQSYVTLFILLLWLDYIDNCLYHLN